MAITWRNVDAPQGLNQAAGQVQQSFRDVANSLKDVGQNFVDMKSNDAMAALEARLAQEQQLSNVDPLTQMDAGQLRGATSGWIDTNKAREMIQGRQQVLEQQVVGDFNENIAAGNLAGAKTSLAQLENRVNFDASGLTNQYTDLQFGTQLEEARVSGDLSKVTAVTPQQREKLRTVTNEQNVENLKKGIISNPLNENLDQYATTAESQQALSDARVNKLVANKDYTTAKLKATTPEQMEYVRRSEMVNKVTGLNQKLGRDLGTYLTNPEAKIGEGTKIISDARNQILSSDMTIEERNAALASIEPLAVMATQKEATKVTVAPQIDTLFNTSVVSIPEVVKNVFKDQRDALTADAIKDGVSLDVINAVGGENKLSNLVPRFGSGSPESISTINNLIKELEFKNPLIGSDFNARALIQRANDKGIDLGDYSLGAILLSMTGTEFNSWLNTDGTENTAFKVALDRNQQNINSQVDKSVAYAAKERRLTEDEQKLQTASLAAITDLRNNYTIDKVGARPITGEDTLKFNPEAIVRGISGATNNEARLVKEEQKKVIEEVRKEAEAKAAEDLRIANEQTRAAEAEAARLKELRQTSTSTTNTRNRKGPSLDSIPENTGVQDAQNRYNKKELQKDLISAEKELEKLKKAQQTIGSGTFTGVSDSRIKSAENRVAKIKLQLSE